MEKEKILELLKNGFKKLYDKDQILIDNKASERSVLANLKCYLEKEEDFNDYNIDVEYNRE
jgi:hypothetical protein